MSPPGGSRSCLAIHPGSLGDVLLAGPALAHLEGLGFRTTLAVTSHLVALFADSGLVAAARDLEGLGLHRLFVDPVDVRALEVLAGYDAIVSWLGAGARGLHVQERRHQGLAIDLEAHPFAGHVGRQHDR